MPSAPFGLINNEEPQCSNYKIITAIVFFFFFFFFFFCCLGDGMLDENEFFGAPWDFGSMYTCLFIFSIKHTYINIKH